MADGGGPRAAQPRRAGRTGKDGHDARLRLERQHGGHDPGDRDHRTRITFNRGARDGSSGPPELVLNSSVNPGALGAWNARGYTSEPARSVPVRFTARPALIVGMSGNAFGKFMASW